MSSETLEHNYLDEADIWQADEAHVRVDILGQYLDEIGKIPLLDAEQETDLAKKIEAGLLADKLLGLKSDDEQVRSQTKEDIYRGFAGTKAEKSEQDSWFEKLNDMAAKIKANDLQRLSAEGVMAKKQFIEANLRLVIKPAKTAQRLSSNTDNMDLLDLIQHGNAGLIRAVEKYDVNKINPESDEPFKFSTYAMVWIKQFIREGIGEDNSAIRIPKNRREDLELVQRSQSRFERESGRPPTTEELVKLTSKSAKKVDDTLGMNYFVDSLNELIGGDGTSELGEVIKEMADRDNYLATEGSDDDLSAQNTRELRATLMEEMYSQGLTNKEIYALVRQFELDGNAMLSSTEVASELGMKNANTVGYLRRQALAKLQKSEVLAKLIDAK